MQKITFNETTRTVDISHIKESSLVMAKYATGDIYTLRCYNSKYMLVNILTGGQWESPRNSAEAALESFKDSAFLFENETQQRQWLHKNL